MTTTPTLPKLIITPSTPLPPNTAYFDLPPSSLPSPYFQTISEKDERQSRRRSQSFDNDKVNDYTEKRPAPIRSYSLPTDSYLSLPSPTRPKSGKRPLRSPLISILFLAFAFLMVLSTAMCTSSSAGKLLDIQREAGKKINDLLRIKGCKEHNEGSQISEVGFEESGSDQGGAGGVKSLFDFLWNREEEYHHYANSLVTAGPAISLDGSAIWDFDSQF
ncbi:hypothetical protein V865_001764 [Kwoniella europaea PYCC6329]|uniref:Transmembrane protein n=1 Tax=Kwoniella europaea PYCC6329 TaxID=1423913 RepID=A0AAX4KD79_9TREE